MTAPIRTLEGMAHQIRLRGLPAEIAILCVQVEPVRGVRIYFLRHRRWWLVAGKRARPATAATTNAPPAACAPPPSPCAPTP